ncbi:MAG: DUF4238 domain-containing protein [Planctomycetes bacterium]|nr:DUF4238 domain-containing protein [Planctomycetota bacterium]
MHDRKYWNEPNLSPTDVKRQHYVPKLLLRRFAVDDKIRVYDLDEDREYTTSIINTAVASRFYNENVEENQFSTESWLARLEGNAASVITKLVDDPDSIVSLTTDEEFSIARFLVAQRFRTPSFRDYNDKISASLLHDIKDMCKKQIYHQYSKKEADDIWKKVENKPDHFWFNEPEPQQPAAITNFILGEVQGYANLLRAAPWRIGIAPATIRLYTSDNPVAGYLRPVRPWWEGAAFASLDYFIPLSPEVLLKIERRTDRKDEKELQPRGERLRNDYSEWEISFVRHVVTNDAVRYLYGEGTIVPRDCATTCRERIDSARLNFAINYLGFDPQPPKGLKG